MSDNFEQDYRAKIRIASNPPTTDELIKLLIHIKYDWMGSLAKMNTAFELIVGALDLSEDKDKQELVRIFRLVCNQSVTMGQELGIYANDLYDQIH
jgi:hypothetical protein